MRKLEQQIQHDLPQDRAAHRRRPQVEKVTITNETIREFLGGIKVRVDTEIAERTKRDSVAVGLAWTPVGGGVLFVEASRMKGKGSFNITGQIGDVMKESMQAALTWVRSNAKKLGLDEDLLKDADLRASTFRRARSPRTAPARGVTMATAIVSC